MSGLLKVACGHPRFMKISAKRGVKRTGRDLAVIADVYNVRQITQLDTGLEPVMYLIWSEDAAIDTLSFEVSTNDHWCAYH